MSLQTDAARELHRFLTELGTPYAIIGGLAVQFWGEPRFTQDVDVTVMTPPDGAQPLIQHLLARFPARIPDAAAFARRNRVILVRASNGCPIGWLRQFGAVLETHEAEERFEQIWRRGKTR